LAFLNLAAVGIVGREAHRRHRICIRSREEAPEAARLLVEHLEGTISGQLSGSDRLAGSGEISPDTERIQARKTLRGKVFARRNSQAR
jgi:hypothetical protein